MSIAPDVIAAAQAAQRKWKIPAAITLAQYGIESSWGVHEPSHSNNGFGMKARPGDPFVIVKTREVNAAGESYYIDAPFRVFATIADAFDAHAELLATAGAYAIPRSMLEGGITAASVNAFANALTHRYATDPNYGTALIALMKADGLYAYDGLSPAASPVAQPPPAPAPTLPLPPVSVPVEPPTIQKPPVSVPVAVAGGSKGIAQAEPLPVVKDSLITAAFIALAGLLITAALWVAAHWPWRKAVAVKPTIPVVQPHVQTQKAPTMSDLSATIDNFESLLEGKSDFNEFIGDEGALIEKNIASLAAPLQPAVQLLYASFKAGASGLVGAGLTAVGPILAQNTDDQATEVLNLLSVLGVPTRPPLNIAEQAVLVTAINGLKAGLDRIGIHIATSGQVSLAPAAPAVAPVVEPVTG